MDIKAVLFDLDNTLLWDDRGIDEAFSATCAHAVARHPEINPFDLEAAVRMQALSLYESFEVYPFAKMIEITHLEALWARFDEGALPQFRELQLLSPGYRRESWIRGLHEVGVDDVQLGEELAERFPMERRARPIIYEGTFPVLDVLKDKYKLLLLTNGAPDLQREKVESIPRLASYFDHIVISGDFGAGKPAESIFLYAMSLLGISPEEGLMVGDNPNTDIKGANGVGMRNVWINHHASACSVDHAPSFEVGSLLELPGLIERLQHGMGE
ncbi:HAD family hydrolase [Paenibacillus sp. HB172176]|uniref:HAD family hydrolase n=1 Tax=Paenibacillus sp. HB172176 TaxID=2493690 RepID=UPI00143C9114|nr:HAD family hydrolase [Paenibacillus sp. HB172176]